MKPMSMLLGGILVSSIGVMAVAQQNKPHWNAHAGHAPVASPQPMNAPRAQNFKPPVPRGNLRGDIASNVRALPDQTHDERPAQHR